MGVPYINYKNHPAYGGQFKKPSLNLRLKALKLFLPQCLTQLKLFFIIAVKKRRAKLTPLAKDLKDKLKKIQEEGVLAFHVPDDEMTKIKIAAEPYIKQLEEHKAKVPSNERKFEADKLLKIPSKSNLYELVDKILKSYGIADIASHHKKWPLCLKEIYLHISDQKDIDWRYHFSDLGISEPPTVYMHRDSSMFWMKCLLYLNKVEENNGPFSYVRGSNNWKRPWEYIVSKANDKALLDRCDPKTRELFNALPKLFQKKAEFGNDLLSQMPETSQLMASEVKYTSDKGNLFFVDTDGIHRGGMTLSGKRYMLQIKLE